ncbi:hypothetical protein Cni_G03658 [Canna indica]|uniref:Uncharacterized protein n=1 Tax=Canna indica TaxID=4628 RepID=A0AAQ3JRJ4_9LILI|nr:hypothetical protein Cni_G03658 [Canna indica]
MLLYQLPRPKYPTFVYLCNYVITTEPKLLVTSPCACIQVHHLILSETGLYCQLSLIYTSNSMKLVYCVFTLPQVFSSNVLHIVLLVVSFWLRIIVVITNSHFPCLLFLLLVSFFYCLNKFETIEQICSMLSVLCTQMHKFFLTGSL